VATEACRVEIEVCRVEIEAAVDVRVVDAKSATFIK